MLLNARKESLTPCTQISLETETQHRKEMKTTDTLSWRSLKKLIFYFILLVFQLTINIKDA